MSPKNECVAVGLAGFGTVGGGLAQLLALNADWVRRRSGKDFAIKTITVRDPSKARAVPFPAGATVTSDPMDLIRDPEIGIVVELMGGVTSARKLVLAALEAGRHVVTANKALLAEHGQEIFALAEAKGLHVGFEASVAGGIPIIQTLKESLAGNRIQSLMGILNGTANFILTEMSERGMDFQTALALAQDKGFAEADPTLDVEGWDAAHKLVLLIMLAFGRTFPLTKLSVTGISVVTPMDIAFARELGYRIKLIAQAREKDGRIEAGVLPALIPEHYLLADVKGSYNAVRLVGNAGPVMLYGRGAGDLPTASAVLADVIMVASGRAPNNTGFADGPCPAADIMDLDETVSPHYLRFMVPDRPGVLRDIGAVMAEHGISLAQVVQKGEDQGQGVPIVFLTHAAPAGNVHAAMRDIDALGLPTAKTMHYRIL